MSRFMQVAGSVLLAAAIAASAGPADAQFGKLKDKLKQKAEEKANEKTDEAIDKAADGSGDAPASPGDQTGEPVDKSAEPGAEPSAGEAPAAASGNGGTATSEDMALFTRYDFVPGDKVIFYDDLAGEELGEFPSRWNLDHGVFEIAKQAGRNWIMCTDKGIIRPKIAAGPLPPKYTIELDFWTKNKEAQGHWFHLEWVDAEGKQIGEFTIQDHLHTRLRILEKDLANKDLAKPLSPGSHTMRVMATKTTLKCYIDNERVANVPAVEGFQPAGFELYLDPWRDEPDNPMLVGSFRYAEGGKTLKEQLDEAGRIVTHGILFDSGSDRIKGESYKTLADIAQLLTENPPLRLSIEGHTDSDGSDASNLTLSQSRASAVKTFLGATYKIDPGRLGAKGWGESTPIDSNDTAEGKANNRRVELVKL